MSNLTNVYAHIAQNYTNLNIHFGNPPSYVKTLSGLKNQKIIFIYKEDSTKSVIHYSSPKTDDRGEKSADTNFNITGSPLQDDNSINNLINTSIANRFFVSKPWKDVEESYAPISIEFAREILTDLMNRDFPKGTHGWIFILCTDPAKPAATNSEFLFCFHKTEKYFTDGVMKYYGVIKNEDKSMKELLRRHGLGGKAEINIESIFEINADLSLRFMNNFSKEAPTLAHINNSSDICLYQRIEVGKSHPLCESLWNEIKLLFTIKNDIVNSKNNSWEGSLLEPSFAYGMRSFETMQESVNHILMDVITIAESIDENVSDSHLESVVKRTAHRTLSDMTDQLWEVLKNANSYADLKKILTFIFQISSRSCIVNVPMNKNRLSELIRELSQQRLAVPHLTSTEPLELLLEIGLEKVLKDYEFIFSESKICNLKDVSIGQTKTLADSADDGKMGATIRKSLAPSAAELAHQSAAAVTRKTLLHGADSRDSDEDYGFYNSRFNEREVDAQISNLAQIHLTVEHILMIQNNLNMEHDYTAIAKKLLQGPVLSFEELQLQKYDRLDVRVTNEQVIGLVENLVPNSQKVNIKTENKFKLNESTFYFNIEQIVPILAQKEKEDEIADKKGDTFHFISYMTSIRKF